MRPQFQSQKIYPYRSPSPSIDMPSHCAHPAIYPRHALFFRVSHDRTIDRRPVRYEISESQFIRHRPGPVGGAPVPGSLVSPAAVRPPPQSARTAADHANHSQATPLQLPTRPIPIHARPWERGTRSRRDRVPSFHSSFSFADASLEYLARRPWDRNGSRSSPSSTR